MVARAVRNPVVGCAGAVTLNVKRAWSPVAASLNGCDSGRDGPTGGRGERERAILVVAIGADLHVHRVLGAGVKSCTSCASASETGGITSSRR